MKTYRIYLLHHGMTEAGEKHMYVGKTDLPLSPDGFHDLVNMQRVYTYPNARRFYAAPHTRCRQTLEMLYPGCDILDVPGLAECDFGEWEGKTLEELKSDETFQNWISGKQGEIPGGESAAVFQARVMQAFEETVTDILKSGETDTAICVPGGVLMLIMTVYGLPKLEMKQWVCGPGNGFCLRVTPEIWMREPVAEALCMIPWEKEEETETEDS